MTPARADIVALSLPNSAFATPLTDKFLTQSEYAMNSRRHFIRQVSFAGTALIAGQSFAQNPMVVETDGQATALGYKADTTKVDKAKYPKHLATQACKNCQLYAGKAADKAGACPLFAGKQVAPGGWCSAWVMKAG